MTPKTSLRFLLIIVLLALIPVTVDTAQPIPLPLDVQVAGDDFGREVALDGDTALIEAANGVYIYIRSGSTWTQQAKLEASTGVALNVQDIDGDTAIVSGRSENTPDAKGAIYVFVRSGITWTEQAKLIVDHDYIYYFPSKARLDGDYIMAGAMKTGGNPDKPVFYAYGFVRTGTNWSGAMEIPMNATLENDVALSGNTAVLFNYRNNGETYAGYVYLHDYIPGTGWVRTTNLYSGFQVDPNNPELAGAFTREVVISGDTLVVSGGLYNYNTNEYFYDVLFVFARSGGIWTLQAVIEPINNQGHRYNFYMSSIALDGDTLILDVPDPDTGKWSELVYLNNTGNWTLQTIITKVQSDYRSVALSGNTLLLGIPMPDAATYILVRSNNVWSQQAKLTLPGSPDELLANGGFEGIIAETGSSWKLKGMWGRRDYEVFHTGSASFLFIYGTEKLIQNIDLTRFNLKAGDKIRLTGFYNKLSTNSYKTDVWLYISYANLPEDQLRITVQKPTSGWQNLPKLAATLKATPTRIRVVIQAAADNYQYIYFDDLSLKLVPPALKANQASELLPLP